MTMPRIVLIIKPSAMRTINHRRTPLLKLNPALKRIPVCAVESIASQPERMPRVCQMPDVAKNNSIGAKMQPRYKCSERSFFITLNVARGFDVPVSDLCKKIVKLCHSPSHLLLRWMLDVLCRKHPNHRTRLEKDRRCSSPSPLRSGGEGRGEEALRAQGERFLQSIVEYSYSARAASNYPNGVPSLSPGLRRDTGRYPGKTAFKNIHTFRLRRASAASKSVFSPVSRCNPRLHDRPNEFRFGIRIRCNDLSAHNVLIESRANGRDELSIFVNSLAAGRRIKLKRVMVLVNAIVKAIPNMFRVGIVIERNISPKVVWMQLIQLPREITRIMMIRLQSGDNRPDMKSGFRPGRRCRSTADKHEERDNKWRDFHGYGFDPVYTRVFTFYLSIIKRTSRSPAHHLCRFKRNH